MSLVDVGNNFPSSGSHEDAKCHVIQAVSLKTFWFGNNKLKNVKKKKRANLTLGLFEVFFSLGPMFHTLLMWHNVPKWDGMGLNTDVNGCVLLQSVI